MGAYAKMGANMNEGDGEIQIVFLHFLISMLKIGEVKPS